MTKPLRALVLLVIPAMLLAQTAADQFKAGRVAFDTKKVDAAVQAFEKAVAQEDTVAEYHVWLARALGLQSENVSWLRVPFIARRFKREWERAVQLAPNNIEAREGLLEVYLGPHFFGGDIAKAREQADAISRLNAFRGLAAHQAIANHGKNPSEQAEGDARAAAAAFPDSATTVNILVNFLLMRNRNSEALATADSFVARRPGNAQALFVFGRVSAITGLELDKGERALRTVLAAPRIGPDTVVYRPANVHYRLGDILAKMGRKEEARLEYEMALKLDPTLAGARAGLEKCCR